MLLNLSNHPSDKWHESQMNSAVNLFGSVKDVPFPLIDPFCSENDIILLADEFTERVLNILAEHTEDNNAVHIMGELTFCFATISKLITNGIKCVASTTGRKAIINPDGSKTTRFEFVKFREYTI